MQTTLNDWDLVGISPLYQERIEAVQREIVRRRYVSSPSTLKSLEDELNRLREEAIQEIKVRGRRCRR